MNFGQRFTLLLAALLLSGCSKTVTWEEQVLLNDGRVVVVTQKKRCEGGNFEAEVDATCIAREAWLTINLPEFSDKGIVWHENLDPMVMNIHQGRLYVVGRPPHTLEFRAYGATNPPYFGFVWMDSSWRRIPFTEIPVEIYETNMLIESIPPKKTRLLTLAKKNAEHMNGDPVYPAFLRRVDPKHVTSAY